MFSLLSLLVACGSEPVATPAPATPEVAGISEVVVTPPAVTPCVDSTPDNGVDECAQPATVPAPAVSVTPATPAAAQ